MILLSLTLWCGRNLLVTLVDLTAGGFSTNPLHEILTVNFFLLEDFLKMTKCSLALTHPPVCNPATLVFFSMLHDVNV
jgi:hypothetical protein